MNVLTNVMPTLAEGGMMSYASLIFVIAVSAALLVLIMVSLAKGNNIWWKPATVGLVLMLCFYFLFPPEEKLRLGIDLSGGTSLLYEIDTAGVDNPEDAIGRLVKTLQNRVDPTGSANLVWRVEGNNRLEIQMPQPTANVLELKQTYRASREAVEASNVTREELLNTLELNGDARQNAMAQLVRGIAVRGEMLTRLAAEYDQWVKAREAYKETAPETQARIIAASENYEAKQKFDNAMNRVLATNLNLTEVVNTLQMSNLLPPLTSEERELPEEERAKLIEERKSPQAAAIANLKKNNPDHKALLDKLFNDYEDYSKTSGSLDDANDLIRLLRGAGILEFRIAVDERKPGGIPIGEFRERLKQNGPNAFANERAKWYLIKDQNNPFAGRVIEQDSSGNYYTLLWDVPAKRIAKDDPVGWAVTGASPSQDQNGLPAVSFNLNTIGARKMQRITKDNIQEPLAIVLDKQVYSAPNINTTLSGQIQVTGNFSNEEVAYLVRTLNAGSSDVQLSEEPISIRVVGASLGGGNLSAGMQAAMFSLLAVAIFMMLYYFFNGLVADLALVANLVVILGIMSLSSATFTLPGIAGIVLTIGMCVDANVLIFERIREELRDGRDIQSSMRLGYQKAFSSIIDGNLTNLIVCIILFFFTTADVKGFATTLGVGICATLFTSLFMTRVIFELWDRFVGIKKMAMLPTTIDAVEKLLRPNFNWVKLRYGFFVFSAVIVVFSAVMIMMRGNDLLDIEFRGGTEVAFQLKPENQDDIAANPKRMTMSREQVSDFVKQIGEWATDGKVDPQYAVIWEAIKQRQADRRSHRIEEMTNRMNTDKLRELAELGDEATAADREAIDKKFEEEIAKATKQITEETDLQPLAKAVIQELGDKVDGQASEFAVRTTVPDAQMVASAVTTRFAEFLQIEKALSFYGQSEVTPLPGVYLPIEKDTLGESLEELQGISSAAAQQDTTEYKGGVAFVLRDVYPPANVRAIEERLKAMRLQPDFANVDYRNFKVVGLTQAEQGSSDFNSFAVLVRDPDITSFNDRRVWQQQLVNQEWEIVREAMGREKSLGKVSNFTGTVAQTLSQQALAALLLSLVAIVAYIWVRFGSLRYGLAAIAALVHDVTIALGLVALTGGALYNIPFLRDLFFLEPFSLNMGLIAALLTIIGYSLNDTIVLFDRIRENRGKLSFATPEIVNTSINQTISRTILTSFTTFLAVGVLYIAGGEGIRGFAFCLLIGVVVGTYSSIGIASQLVLLGLIGKTPTVIDEDEEGAELPKGLMKTT